MIPALQQGQFGRYAPRPAPSFANVSLLLHMDGANGGTTFTDSSKNAHTVTPSSVTTSTAWSKFGGASALIASASGSSNRLNVPHHASFDMGTGEFTIEFWMRLTTVQTALLVTKAVATSYYPYQVHIATDKIGFRCFFNAGALIPQVVGATTLVAGVDYFVQARRRNVSGSGAYLEVALNGVLDGVLTTGLTDVIFDNTDLLTIGNYNSGAQLPLQGYIDDLRITKGEALDFAVPIVAFPSS